VNHLLADADQMSEALTTHALTLQMEVQEHAPMGIPLTRVAAPTGRAHGEITDEASHFTPSAATMRNGVIRFKPGTRGPDVTDTGFVL
jgi:hypothetical protein